MTAKRLTLLAAFLVLAGFSAALVLAQGPVGGGFDISWNTIDGGGGSSSGGGFNLNGTIGQVDAGNMSGGGFSLAGGFWPGVSTGSVVNSPPTAVPQEITGDRAVPLKITLVGTDPDVGNTLTYLIVSLPLSGDLTDGTTTLSSVPHQLSGDMVIYDARAGALGIDSFQFKVNDGTEDSSPATVTINIVPCAFQQGMIQDQWNLVGWACDQPGVPSAIAGQLGVLSPGGSGASGGGLVRILEWDPVQQSFTNSYRSDRPFNTLNQLTKWNGYWLFYQVP